MANKLEFIKLFAKNFRAIDNVGQTIDYTHNATTLVSSMDNGQGKSTLSVWALYFVLFDKPYGKDAKKASLVNSRNNKDCLVELEFKTKGSLWKVVRGIKPNIFEIWKDGVLLDNAASKDPQEFLENKVLGFNEKTFGNMIVLHKDRFVPFANMNAAERRAYVENMLDLNVFSYMSDITKERIKSIKRDVDNFEYEEKTIQTKIEAKNSIIHNLNESLDKKNNQLDTEIEKYKSSNVDSEAMLLKLKEKESQLENNISKFDYDPSTHTKVKQIYQQMKDKINLLGDRISTVKGMDTCPTCHQKVSTAMQNIITKEDRETLDKLNEKLGTIIDKDQEYDLKNNDLKMVQAEMTKIQDAISKLNNTISSNNSFIQSFLIMKMDNGEVGKIKSETEEKNKLQESLDFIVSNSRESLKSLDYHNTLLGMLKDSGVKSDIIKQYIPYLNTKINEYLDALNFNIHIELDEEFDITILSPERKNQGLGSLSSGQQCRINLAMLFAWRDIAQSKSSLDCNVLIMDEVLESLSEAGVIDFMSLYKGKFKNQSNLFVITQRASEFETYFDNTIMFKMINDFSVLMD